jgi:rfaE bifunctional protein nucleotidyltransferase chain/domain
MNSIEIIKNKIYNIEKYSKDVDKKVVFTNGCFDILHFGHVEYLSKAKDMGDVLVVGVNSDSSPYWKTKGDNRPINNQVARSMIIASLEVVDFVIIFSEETPLNLIDSIKPDILVKGKDYREEEIVGYDVIKKYGGVVKTIELTEGYSTTNIIKKLK